MKYLLLVCWDSRRMDGQAEPEPGAPPAATEELPWVDDLRSRGIWLTGGQLAPPRRARSVRIRDGKTIVTDGRSPRPKRPSAASISSSAAASRRRSRSRRRTRWRRRARSRFVRCGGTEPPGAADAISRSRRPRLRGDQSAAGRPCSRPRDPERVHRGGRSLGQQGARSARMGSANSTGTERPRRDLALPEPKSGPLPVAPFNGTDPVDRARRRDDRSPRSARGGHRCRLVANRGACRGRGTAVHGAPSSATWWRARDRVVSRRCASDTTVSPSCRSGSRRTSTTARSSSRTGAVASQRRVRRDESGCSIRSVTT